MAFNLRRGMNLLRGKKTRLLPSRERMAMGPRADRGLAIGEYDANVFNCPVCARPLAVGVSRCPGCGTRLVMGIRLSRAGAILAMGVVLGVIAGGAFTASALTLGSRPNGVAVVPSAAPSGANVGASPSVPPEVPANTAPQAALSALSGTTVVNGRIAVDAATLSATLADKRATSIELARAFRSLAADAALGIDVAARLGSWTNAATVRTELETFYQAMAESARNALRAPFSDPASYRRSATEMKKILAGLGKVDAASRALASTVNLELPPVVLPGAASASVKVSPTAR